MLIRDTHLTPALARWLRESHDDDQPELRVRALSLTDVDVDALGIGRLITGPESHAIRVIRADGTEPSDTERTEITARLAAHAVEPLT